MDYADDVTLQAMALGLIPEMVAAVSNLLRN
jgi:ethanolamine ammonia-lyase large subunit